jgi:hypothetical protein
MRSSPLDERERFHNYFLATPEQYESLRIARALKSGASERSRIGGQYLLPEKYLLRFTPSYSSR